MSQMQFYKYATFILLLINIALIVFFVSHGPRHGGKIRAHDLLKMTDQQHELFLKSAHQHIQQMTDINATQKDLLHHYFSQILAPNHPHSDSLLTQVQSLELKKIQLTYQHLSEVKSFLKPEQINDFEHFINHILSSLLKGNKKRPPLPKGF